MADVWVPNSSPLIVLAKVGLLDLLHELSSDVLLAQPVIKEILSGPINDPARLALESGWGTQAMEVQPPALLVEWGLGPGETAVVAIAMETNTRVAVIDDGAARNCAKTLGVRLIGSLGVVVRARRLGMIPSAAAVVKSLLDAGLYLDETTIQNVLERIGEDWIR